MKLVSTLFVAVILLFTSAIPAVAQPAELTAQEHEEIAKLVTEVDEAASALDVERFLRTFVDGPHLAYAVDGRLHTGLAEVRAAHTASWAALKAGRFRSTVTRAVALGSGAVAVAATGQSEVTLKTGETKTGHYAVTAVVVRTPDGWRILQVHESAVGD
jgi:uncharacterized protein (TIGR02246 family)